MRTENLNSWPQSMPPSPTTNSPLSNCQMLCLRPLESGSELEDVRRRRTRINNVCKRNSPTAAHNLGLIRRQLIGSSNPWAPPQLADCERRSAWSTPSEHDQLQQMYSLNWIVRIIVEGFREISVRHLTSSNQSKARFVKLSVGRFVKSHSYSL